MKSKKCTLGLLLFYLAALTWIIVFKLQVSAADLPHLRTINLIPFADPMIVNGAVSVGEMVQNLLAFVPYGLLLHVLWEEKPLFQQILPIVCTSLLFELLQFLFAIGGTDITDLITNSCGGCLGIFLAIGLSRLSGGHWRTILNTVCLTGAVLLSALLAVVFAVN